jgi:hypothetical protein
MAVAGRDQLGDEQLDGVHPATADLDLGLRAGGDVLDALDAGEEVLVEAQHAVDPQHVRHQVVGEHREPVHAGEGAGAVVAEGEGEILHRDLGPLEDRHLPAPVRPLVAPGRQLGEDPHHRLGVAAGGGHEAREGAVVPVEHHPAQLGERLGEAVHEPVGGSAVEILAEDPGAVGGRGRREPIGPQRSGRRDMALEARRHRPVAGHPRALAQPREGAGPEVDRVERQHERGGGLVVAVAVVTGVVAPPADLVGGQLRGVRAEAVVVDPHPGRLPGNPRGAVPDVVESHGMSG